MYKTNAFHMKQNNKTDTGEMFKCRSNLWKQTLDWIFIKRETKMFHAFIWQHIGFN